MLPADGFYEWRRGGAGRSKVPHLIRLAGGGPFALAGLWETWAGAGGETLESCAVLTCAPNAVVRPLHDRMPVVPTGDAVRAWLDPAPMTPAAAAELLVPYPAERMEAYPVSSAVNSPSTDGPACIEPAAEPDAAPDPQPGLFG